MKKLMLITLIFTFLFTGCVQNTPSPDAGNGENTTASTQLANSGEPASQNSEDSITFSAKVIKAFGDSLLISDIDGGIDSIIFVPSGDSPLNAGDIVEVTYDGMILESYPLQLSHATVAFKEKSDDIVGLYRNIFFELYEKDSGLNSNINIISVDLSNTNNLTKAEKQALLYLIGSELPSDGNMQVIGKTFEELKEENMLTYDGANEKFPYFENGLLFTFPTENESEKDFELTATKWRSPLGAYGFNIKASLKDNTWQYKIENEFIS